MHIICLFSYMKSIHIYHSIITTYVFVMSICTGRGSDGETDLLFGKKVSKSDQRVEVGGSIDELNAWVGVVRAGDVPLAIKDILEKIQAHLVAIMGEIATEAEDLGKYASKGYSRISDDDREWLVSQIKQAESGENPVKFRGWAVPGAAGNQQAAFLDVCRTVCRRAERQCWQWDVDNVYLLHKRYLNNLSDLFWVLAREGEKA